MKSFSQLFQGQASVLSFEFFPPKKEDSLEQARSLMKELAESFSPDFMTVTYGAGGGTRGFTQQLVSYIHNTLNIPAVSHLTCVDHSQAEIKEVLDDLRDEGISHILALRGDPPKGVDEFIKHPEGFSSASELTAFISKMSHFSLATAGYPEGHPEALSEDIEMKYLRSKVEAGAEVIITQLFFDPEIYLKFVDKARKYNIQTPILPGVMPISNVAQVERFTSMCGASIPSKLKSSLLRHEGDPDAVIEIGTEFAIRQLEKLLKEGAPGVHLYTLNKLGQVSQILNNIGVQRFQSSNTKTRL